MSSEDRGCKLTGTRGITTDRERKLLAAVKAARIALSQAIGELIVEYPRSLRRVMRELAELKREATAAAAREVARMIAEER